MTSSRIGLLALSIVALAALVAAPGAQAADGYLGFQMGPSFVNEGIGTRFAFGVHAGEKLSERFGVGFYYSYETLASASVSFAGATASADFNEHVIAFEPNFFPSDTLGGLYLGAKIGLGITTFSATISDSSKLASSVSASDSTTNFAGGPAIGYIGSITPNLGLGADFAYIFVTTSGSTLQLRKLMFSINYMF